ncbi:hypothetical protein [Microbacterium paraoxydans]|uniref:hypothetical protein n=1 Tax=Microbacterium paraoxydans TaxID=199592 RepID=UPI003D76194E
MTRETSETVTVTVLGSGLTIPGRAREGAYWSAESRIALRGEVVEIDRSETLDRTGRSWLDLNAEQQKARWGRPMFELGDHSEGIDIGEDDVHGFRYKKWVRDVEEAQRIVDPAERAAAFTRIKREYPEQSRTTQTSRPY